MTEQELIEARELVAYFRGRRLLPDIDTPLPFRDQIPVLPKMLDSLLKAIDERDAIIHDLQLDGRSLARMAEQRFLAEMIEWAKNRKDDERKFTAENLWYASAESAMGEVIVYLQERSAFGPNDPHIDPLPPDQARAEADRLRKEVARLQESLSDVIMLADAGLDALGHVIVPSRDGMLFLCLGDVKDAAQRGLKGGGE